MNTSLIVTGDLNSRTGTEDENYNDTQIDIIYIEIDHASTALPDRNNCDLVVNILNICCTYNLKILNGRSFGGPIGNYSCHNINLGSSAIDYSICSQKFTSILKILWH